MMTRRSSAASTRRWTGATEAASIAPLIRPPGTCAPETAQRGDSVFAAAGKCDHAPRQYEGRRMAVKPQGRPQIDAGSEKAMKVELELLDDTSTQSTAVNLADRLINSDKVNFLLGTYATNLVEAQSAAAEQYQMLYVNGGGAASAIYKRGYKWVFGLLAPVELLAESMMKWIDQEQKAGKLPFT